MNKMIFDYPMIIVDDQSRVIKTLNKNIVNQVGWEPCITLDPNYPEKILKNGKLIDVLAFDFDLTKVSNRNGLEFLLEYKRNYNKQIANAVLFTRQGFEKTITNICNKNNITYYEKDLDTLHENLLSNLSSTDNVMQKNLEIQQFKKLEPSKVWSKINDKIKRKLIRELEALENDEARFAINMQESIKVKDLILEIENETHIGMKRIESYANLTFRLEQLNLLE